MADSDESQNPPSNTNGQKKQTRGIEVYIAIVDTFAALILLATMIGVFCYAHDAGVANTLTRSAIDIQTRPYIEINLDPSQQIVKAQRVVSGGTINTISVAFQELNIGKLPAQGMLRRIAIWSPTKLAVAPEFDDGQNEEQFLFPTEGGLLPRTAFGNEPMTDGQYSDLSGGLGYVYFRAEIRYGGETQYATAVCWQISLTKDANASTLGMPRVGHFEVCPNNKKVMYAY